MPIHPRLSPKGSFVFVSEMRSLTRPVRGAPIDAEAVARNLRFEQMAADQNWLS